MRRFLFHVWTVVMAAAIGFPGVVQAESIQWAPDLDVARATASGQEKLLLLHFWSPDCVPCKQLEQTVFPNEFVAQAINQQYVPLKVNALRNPDLRNHFSVDRWPTDIIATADGKLVHRMTTPLEADRYVHALMTIASKHTAATKKVAPPIGEVAQQPSNQYKSRWSDQAELMPPVGPSVAQARQPGVNFRQHPPGLVQSSPSSAVRPGLGWDAGRSPMPSATASTRPGMIHGDPQREVVNPYIAPKAVADAASVSGAAPATLSGPEESTQAGSVPASAGTRFGVAIQQAKPPVVETPPVGLDGRCPVTLIRQGSWKAGDSEWGAIHRGRLYLFAGREEQQAFLAAPDQFSPVLAGMDVVRLADLGKVVQGDREYGVLFDDDGKGPNPSRIYLFDSAETRNRFESTPDVYLQPVMEALRRNALHTMLR